MKFMSSQMNVFLDKESKQNFKFISRFLSAAAILIIIYSILFHAIMSYEDRDMSWITGLYWTLTVMTTLGFGDITFGSDLGKIFTIIVLFSGILCFMLLLPFTFVRFVYQPWLDSQSKKKVPKELPIDANGHVLVIGTDDIAKTLMKRLKQYNYPCWIISEQFDESAKILDAGIPVMRGELDLADTYKKARVERASLVVALQGDMKNTNITATVHESCPEVPIVSQIDHERSKEILYLAGCRRVFNFTRLLGHSMAKRVVYGKIHNNTILTMDNLRISEAPATNTKIVGKPLKDLDLTKHYGITVAGVWQRTKFIHTTPDTVIDSSTTMLVAGSKEDIDYFVADIHESTTYTSSESPVIIIGFGRVGKAVAETLSKREIPYVVLDSKHSALDHNDSRHFLGNAEDLQIARKAKADTASCIVITTHSDDVNIFLTLLYRKLRPEAQIISRSSLERNVGSMYAAGATMVMEAASLATNAIINVLEPERVYMVTEGMNIFKVDMPENLCGLTLRDCNIRNLTQCNVLGIKRDGEVVVKLYPEIEFMKNDKLILIGSSQAEAEFNLRFPEPEMTDAS